MPPKYASPYSVVKTPIQQTKFYSLFDARNKETNQIWLLRVMHHQPIQKFEMTDHLAYNQEALLNLKEREHVIYVNEIFLKNEDTFFIEEKWDKKLSNYLDAKKCLTAEQVQTILKDVFHGLCDIYEEGYMHRNIRPQHIVFVQGDPTAQGMWKIETLVLDNKQFPVETPFTWKKQTASPEQRNQKDELDEQMLDAQIVWNFGYLGMQLLNGNEFMNKKITKDSDTPWNKIKQLCTKSPSLYELIEKCYRYKFNDRVSLKKFFQLTIFRDCERDASSQFFLTASKIFKTKTFSSISMNFKGMKSVNLAMKSRVVKNQASPSPQNAVMNKIKEQEPEQEDEISPIRGSLLSGISSYLNFIQINEPLNKLNQNKSIIQFYFIKLALLFLQKSPKISSISSRLKDEGNSLINNKSKIVKRIKNTDNYLLKQFNIDTKQSHTLDQLLPIFNKLCGYAYTRVRESFQKNEKTDVVKALAYFGLAAVVVNTDNLEQLTKYFEQKRGQSYLQAFEKATPEICIKMSQELIAKYFKIA